jgi:hypothetical protein
MVMVLIAQGKLRNAGVIAAHDEYRVTNTSSRAPSSIEQE